MKKTIILLALLVLSSCSKDGDGTLPVTYQNLAGQWKFKSIVKSNGTVTPYVGRCTDKEDKIDIFEHREVILYNYYPDCSVTEDQSCSDFVMTPDGKLYASGPLFSEGTVKDLKSSGFKIEYDQPKNLGFIGLSVSDVKAIIFEKR